MIYFLVSQDTVLGKVWLWDMSFEQMSSCLSRLLPDGVPDVIRTYPLLLLSIDSTRV